MKLPRWLERPWTVDLTRMVRAPGLARDCWRDLGEAVQAWAPFEPHRPIPDDGRPVVLFRHWRDDIFDAKIAAMIGYAVREAGGRPVYSLGSWTYARTHHIHRALSPGHVRIDQTDDDAPLPADLAQLAADGSLSDLMDARFDGTPLGRLVLSWRIRELRDTLPDLLLEDRQRLTACMREAWCEHRTAERVLDALRPSRLVMTEPGYLHNGPWLHAALRRGIDVVFPGGSWRDDAHLFKRYRAPVSHPQLPATVDRDVFARRLAEGWDATREAQLHEAFDERYGGKWQMQRTFQPDQVVERFDPKLAHPRRREGRKLVVVFCHVLWDATFWSGEDLFDDYATWLEETTRVAREVDDVDWIIKTHPANSYRASRGDVQGCGELRLLEERFGTLPPHIHVLEPDAPVTALQLFQNADVGVTVRGMPGFEMAAFGKAVLTAGTGPYDRLGFTHDFAHPTAYLDALRSLATLPDPTPEQTLRAKQYALALFRERPFVLESFRIALNLRGDGAFHPLDRNLFPVEGAADDPADLRALGRWLLSSDDADWMRCWHRDDAEPSAR